MQPRDPCQQAYGYIWLQDNIYIYTHTPSGKLT